MAFLDAESCDDTINGFADRVTACAEKAVVFSSRDGKLFTTGIEHFTFRELFPHAPKDSIIPQSLQYLHQDEVYKANVAVASLPFEPNSVLVFSCCQVVDPNRGVHDDHASIFRGVRKAA